MEKAPARFRARVLRKEQFLPRYIVVRPEHVSLTARQCAKAGLDTNDTCIVTIVPLDRPTP